jgi:hypothetical protein
MDMAVDKIDAAQPSVTLDEAKMHAFVDRVLLDWGAVSSAPLVMIGDRLGLYDAMADAGAITSQELARRTGTQERYIREWLLNQAAGGYIEYDPSTGRYAIPAEHAAVLPALFGGFQTYLAMAKSVPGIAEAFRNGGGVAWGEHDAELFVGIERVFRPGYEQFLISSWIPALDGVAGKLAPSSRTWAVGTVHPPFCWHRPIRTRSLSASTTTRPRLTRRVGRLPRLVSTIVCGSRSSRRRSIRPR